MEYLKVGYITKPHGITGELKVFPLTDEPSRFYELKKIYICFDNSYVSKEIKSIKISKNIVIMKIKNCNTRDEAEKLRDIYIYINREEGLDLSEGEYYTQDLIDCRILYNDEYYGEVKHVINEGTCDILIIKYYENEIYYPMLKDNIKEVNINKKLITINIIDGYFN